MSKLESNISRIRKLDEMVGELSELLQTYKAQRDMLIEDTTPELLEDKSVFNVFVHKNLSAGLIGNNYFSVAFPTSLGRKGDKRLDDQVWLLKIKEDYNGMDYVRGKFELDKAKITADYKAGKLDDEFMDRFGLKWLKTAKLSVLRCKSDAEAKDLIEVAKKQAESFK
ncbi:MAG: hypothetical protein IKF72_12455 [Kiritimatiellae bacterium]|nr:hypothetical protein [Kiritimatiellia bacterium]